VGTCVWKRLCNLGRPIPSYMPKFVKISGMRLLLERDEQTEHQAEQLKRGWTEVEPGT